MDILLFAGIDLHEKFCFITVMDKEGQVLKEGKVFNEENEILLFFKDFKTPIEAAVEATYNWYWLVDLLEEMGIEVNLANPYKTKIIGESKTKTDKIDARALANLLRMNYLPTCYIADKMIRDNREYLRNRIFLVQMQTAVKNRIHCLLDKHNIPSSQTDLFGKRGLEFLKTLSFQEKTQKALEALLETFESLHGQIHQMNKDIKLSSRENETAQILETIPGIGPLSALMLIYEIGDFHRFPSVKKLVAYSGIFSSTYSSGGKTHHGPITKQGNKYLRWILIQAASAVVCSGKDKRLLKLYHRIKFKKNHGVAKVALAKELLTIAYFLVKKKETYNPNILSNQVKPGQKLSRSGKVLRLSCEGV